MKFFLFFYFVLFLFCDYVVVTKFHTKITSSIPNTISPMSHPECGKLPVLKSKRMIGGKLVNEGGSPWMVSLQPYGYHKCGGAIISEQWIITTAQCAMLMNESTTIVIGTANLRKANSFKHEVEKSFMHEQFVYDSTTDYINYDLGLIKLKNRLQFSDDIQPICLYGLPLFFADVHSYFSGWGSSQRYGKTHEILSTLKMVIVPNNDCFYLGIDLGFELFNNTFCAGSYIKSRKNLCEGDLGGPIVVNVNDRWTVVGILALPPSDCEDSISPSWFILVSLYNEWIEDKMKNN